jgi:hypothetical protein
MRWGIECGKCKRTHIFLEWFRPSEYNIIHSFFLFFSRKILEYRAWNLRKLECVWWLRRDWVALVLDNIEEACAQERARNSKIQCGLNELYSWCLARQKTASFYRTKGMVYNVWVTSESTLYFRIKFILQGSRAACIIRISCPKGHDDMLALWRPPRCCATEEVMWILVRALMHMLDPDLGGGGGCPCDGLCR